MPPGGFRERGGRYGRTSQRARGDRRVGRRPRTRACDRAPRRVEAAYSLTSTAPPTTSPTGAGTTRTTTPSASQNVLLQTDWNAGPVKGHAVAPARRLHRALLGRGARPRARPPLAPHAGGDGGSGARRTARFHRGRRLQRPLRPRVQRRLPQLELVGRQPLRARCPTRSRASARTTTSAAAGACASASTTAGTRSSATTTTRSRSWPPSAGQPDDEETLLLRANYMVGDERDFGDARGPTHGTRRRVRPVACALEWLTCAGTSSAGWPRRAARRSRAGSAARSSRRWPCTGGSRSGARRRGPHLLGRRREDLFHADVLPDPTATTPMGSGTLTLDFHPTSHVSMRLEGRYDRVQLLRASTAGRCRRRCRWGMGRRPTSTTTAARPPSPSA